MASISYKAKWKHFRERNWDEIRDAWLADVPAFSAVGAPPDPGLDDLETLLSLEVPSKEQPYQLHADVEGLRRNALWEAVFLFHKCSHTHFASQRLGQLGMHSWCMFNAYHSAYLGARGIMAILGVAFPVLRGVHTAIDLCITPESKSELRRRAIAGRRFQEFLFVRLPQLEQRYLWEAFQRVLRISKVTCFDPILVQELLDLSYENFSPPRNHYLYRAEHWPLNDLVSDLSETEMEMLVGASLDTEHPGFLLRLSFSIYSLLERLIDDLSERSSVIKIQRDGSRSIVESEATDFGRYRIFVSQLAA